MQEQCEAYRSEIATLHHHTTIGGCRRELSRGPTPEED